VKEERKQQRTDSPGRQQSPNGLPPPSKERPQLITKTAQMQSSKPSEFVVTATTNLIQSCNSDLQISISPLDTTSLPSPSSLSDIDVNLNDAKRPHSYAPPFFYYTEGSKHLAFLSHASFVLGSSIFVKLSLVDYAWEKKIQSMQEELAVVDDDEVWLSWATGYENGFMVDERNAYYDQVSLFYTAGSCYFAIVGFLDWLRYANNLNIFMILAGVAGVISGMKKTRHAADYWDCISVHLYMFEAINLIKQDHGYVGKEELFRISVICFMMGGVLDILGCYLDEAGFGGVGLILMDMLSAFLWLGCALVSLGCSG
jgi:hypothetical protein